MSAIKNIRIKILIILEYWSYETSAIRIKKIMSNCLLVFEIFPISITLNKPRLKQNLPSQPRNNSQLLFRNFVVNSRLFSISIRTRVSFNSNRKHHACQINVGSVSVKSRKELLRSFHRIVWIERKCFAVFEIVRHRASKAKSGVHNEERKPRAGNDCKGRAVLEAWPEKAENAEALPTYCLQLYLARRTLV